MSMSINTMSTNNPFVLEAPTEDAGMSTKENPFAPMGSLTDPAVIARLANEFFAALPTSRVPLDAFAPPGPDTAVDSDTAVLDAKNASPIDAASFPPPNEMFAFPRGPGAQSPPGIPSSPPFGPLSETDLRAIVASLAGATALVPGAPVTVPSPPDLLAGGKVSPPAAVPTAPPASEMFSFPAVQAMPSSPPTSPPGGFDVGLIPSLGAGASAAPGSSPYVLNGEKGASPAAGPVFPPVFAPANDMFSFPRVPAGPNAPGLQSSPHFWSPPAAASAPLPTTGTGIPDAPTDVAATAAPLPGVPATAPPDSSAHLDDVEKAVYPGALSSFPSVTELFSFPEVPGAQAAPGLPALPSSLPTIPSKESDVRASIPTPTVPGSLGYSPKAEKARPPVGTQTETQTDAGAATLPTGVKSFEFRPDVAPDELGIAKRPLDPRLIRRDFPILQERVHGRPLVWLDNAATTQKPNAVIDRLSSFYRHENSNIHRAAPELAARANDAYER